MGNNNKFIYAVCGEEGIIMQLNFSIKCLKQFSKYDIIVVTDLSKNTIKILHDNIIDVKTPSNLNNHQSSLFLKTSLHKIIDLTNDYCYLDSTVISLNKGINNIFNHNTGIITFSSDFLKIKEVSPYLINCNCLNNKEDEQSKLNSLINIKDYKDEGKLLRTVIKEEKLITRKIKIITTAYIHIYLKKILQLPLSIKKINSYEQWIYSTLNKAWINNGEIFYSKQYSLTKYIETITNFTFDKKSKEWINKNGEKVYTVAACNHLKEEIKKSFDINISKDEWKLWSSGIFIFNSKSVKFLDTWHEYTLKAFENSNFKTSDICSLAATVWKYKLAKKNSFPKVFQLVSNRKINNVKYIGNNKYHTNDGNTVINPYSINIKDGFGDNEWEVWNEIEKQLKEIEQ